MTDFFRVRLGVVGRSDGHSAAKRSAYQACRKIVDHHGFQYDFTRKREEHVRTLMLVPAGAPPWVLDPEILWQRAGAIEKRCDAQEARIVDFSMPRQVPQALWEKCVRHVYAPFVVQGMVFQVDIHDTPASDGGRNVNVHGLATLRPIAGDGFSSCKNRDWNELFRERSGRVVREMIASRLNAFCQDHGIPYSAHPGSNADRHLPDPEPQLPRWNFSAYARTGGMPDALAALHAHRKVRKKWETAKAEELVIKRELRHFEILTSRHRHRKVSSARRSQRPPSGGDRRAAILRLWHRSGWIEADSIHHIRAVWFDQLLHCLRIRLVDGATIVDRGNAVTLQGRITWAAALETAAVAARHKWTSVQVQGDLAYRDAVTMACLLRGIRVENHSLSPGAQARYQRIVTSAPGATQDHDQLCPPEAGSAQCCETAAKHPFSPGLSSRDIHLARMRFPRDISRTPGEDALGQPITAFKPSSP